LLCNGTKEQAYTMKEELQTVLENMGLKLSEEKTKITHITEGFSFLGYRIIREMGTSKMVTKVEILPCCVLPFLVSVWYPQALSHTPSRERGNA